MQYYQTESWDNWTLFDSTEKIILDLSMLRPDRTVPVVLNVIIFDYLKASFPQYEFTELHISAHPGEKELEISVNLNKKEEEWFEITYYMKRPRSSSLRHMMSTVRKEFCEAVEKYKDDEN
jgi:hypothetical protein